MLKLTFTNAHIGNSTDLVALSLRVPFFTSELEDKILHISRNLWFRTLEFPVILGTKIIPKTCSQVIS